MKNGNGNQIPHFARPRRVETEMRLGKRLEIREHEGITAEIFIGDRYVPVRVWDLTTTGACLIVNDPRIFINGEILKVRLSFAWGESTELDYEVRWITSARKGVKLGLMWVSPPAGQSEAESLPMITLSTSYPVIGYIYKDIYYQERSSFKLIAVSALKMILEVQDQEHLLFPQQRIELQFSLPWTKEGRLTGRIAQVLEVKSESVRVKIDLDAMSPSFEDDVVNYLILDPNVNLEALRKSGFHLKTIANNFRFRFVRTQEEYEQVLKLRYIAYGDAGKLPEGASPETMAAPLDSISRILIALHGDTVVASVAMSFPESEDVVLDTERALPNGYSEQIPMKTQMIEIARLCTDPKYRRGDLLLRMFEHIYKVFATSDRKYLISSTDDKLWPIYRNLGFKKMGLKYAHPVLAGIQHEIILINLMVPVTGKGISFMRWWYLYSNMTNFVEARKKLERRGIAKIRYIVFRIASKGAQLFVRSFKR